MSQGDVFEMTSNDILELPYCESQRLVLHPNRLYRFYIDQQCTSCVALAKKHEELMAWPDTRVVAIDKSLGKDLSVEVIGRQVDGIIHIDDIRYPT